MKIGLFDHVEDGERPVTQLFDERIEFAAAADKAGFYCLHVAEHHATPLNMVPVPGVYLGALARETKHIRLGPLVYLLTLYSPLRLIEEIGMLDHLSHGRLDIGVGRGVSPFELKFHKVEHDESRDIFIDAYKCISAGLATDTLTYNGKYFAYENVPIALRPLQQPHPPFWYASSSAVGATWVGEQGLHFVTLGPTAAAKACIDAYRAALKKRGATAQPKPEFAGGAVIGIQRHIFVADTDAEAHRFAKPAMEAHLANLNWLKVSATSARRRASLSPTAGATRKWSRTAASLPARRKRCAPRSKSSWPSSASITCSPTCSSAPCRLPTRCARWSCFAPRSCRIWKSCECHSGDAPNGSGPKWPAR
jgi:alkanesulfonate monooxygenase SsuD/methylene tetrahydromethanopterin reductase-like flavin-dependent oxidoreductase (luciferase family)